MEWIPKLPIGDNYRIPTIEELCTDGFEYQVLCQIPKIGTEEVIWGWVGSFTVGDDYHQHTYKEKKELIEFKEVRCLR